MNRGGGGGTAEVQWRVYRVRARGSVNANTFSNAVYKTEPSPTFKVAMHSR